MQQRSEVFVKIKIKKLRGVGGGGVRGSWGGQVGGVRVDVYEELKFLCKFKKKNLGGGGLGRGGGGRVGGSGWI